jgi:hypothetical protein
LVEGVIAGNADERTVHAANAFDPGDDFLSDVAAFVEVDMGLVESGLGGEGVFVKFVAPLRDSVEDATVGQLCFGQALWAVSPRLQGGFGEPDITAWGAKAGGRKGEGFGRELVGGCRRVGEVEYNPAFRLVGQFDLIGDEVAVEAFKEGWSVRMDGCVTEQGVWGDADMDGELEFAFDAEDAGWDL